MVTPVLCLAAALRVLLGSAEPLPPDSPRAATPISAAEAEKWREDLRFMAAEMPRLHKNLFHTMSREQFERALRSLDERIPSLPRHRIIVEMARIAAMVGDGHTNVAPTRDPKIGFRTYPIKLYLFADGLYVRAATREHLRRLSLQPRSGFGSGPARHPATGLHRRRDLVLQPPGVTRAPPGG